MAVALFYDPLSLFVIKDMDFGEFHCADAMAT